MTGLVLNLSLFGNVDWLNYYYRSKIVAEQKNVIGDEL